LGGKREREEEGRSMREIPHKLPWKELLEILPLYMS
jgi:hypothetical protein